jgi:hypothetical protein
MSPVELQRVAVRMLFDAAFADAVYRDPEGALPNVPAEQRAWLVRPDRRAWGADPLRRWRALTGLLEEYPAAGALARRARGVDALDAFFSSATFHDCVQGRGSLALAFGDFLAAMPDARTTAVARVERAVARSRRPAPPTRGDYALAPGVEVLVVPVGTLALYQLVGAHLAAHPEGVVAAVAAGALPAHLPDLGLESEALIVERGAEGIGVSEAGEALVALLAAARGGAAREALLAVARAHGCEPGEDADVVDGLVAEGLLRAR